MGRNNGGAYRTSFRPQQNGLAETEADAGAGGVGRGGNSYRRDFRPPQSGLADRNGGGASGGSGASSDSSAFKGQATDLPAVKENGADMSGMISGLEKRLSGVQQDFTQAIHKISEKENEKFDLIFAILSELQSRQAQLEESVRSLKAQYGNGHMVSNGSGHQPPQQQFASSGAPTQFGQMNGQMNGQMGMNGNMGNQQPMQQFAGVTMNPDGTQAMFTPMTQMMIVSSPTNGNMQYVGPQMMTPAGAVVQPMPAQMAMQFVGQGSGPEMGMQFVNGQEASGSQGQAQMNMRPVNASSSGGATWQPEGGNALGGMLNKPQDEVGLNPVMSGDNSSQEGKIDEGSPGQVPSSSEQLTA